MEYVLFSVSVNATWSPFIDNNSSWEMVKSKLAKLSQPLMFIEV